MTYSRVTEVKIRDDLTGGERYTLTLECGHTLTRPRRRRNRRHVVRPPVRVRCYECEKEVA
jgi:hypothetical protein